MNAMREVTASEASRNFSMLLSSVDRGETVVVTRAGRRIATIAPAASSTGAALNEVIDKWRTSEALGEAFDDQMAAVRAVAAAGGADRGVHPGGPHERLCQVTAGETR